jgi:hypothetical protein
MGEREREPECFKRWRLVPLLVRRFLSERIRRRVPNYANDVATALEVLEHVAMSHIATKPAPEPPAVCASDDGINGAMRAWRSVEPPAMLRAMRALTDGAHGYAARLLRLLWARGLPVRPIDEVRAEAAAEERERCCDAIGAWLERHSSRNDDYERGCESGALASIAAIRAMGESEET